MSARLTDKDFEGYLMDLIPPPLLSYDPREILHAHNAAILQSERDLLVALETLYDRCEEMRLNYTDPAGVGQAMEQVHAAIANARRREVRMRMLPVGTLLYGSLGHGVIRHTGLWHVVRVRDGAFYSYEVRSHFPHQGYSWLVSHFAIEKGRLEVLTQDDSDIDLPLPKGA